MGTANEFRMMCASWGGLVTDVYVATSKITNSMPPLKFYANHELDLEFAPLILVDKIVMDRSAFNILTGNRIPEFQRLARTIAELSEHGYIELFDYLTVAQKHKDQIQKVTATDLTSLQDWLPAARLAVSSWEEQRAQYKLATPRLYDDALHYPYGIYSAMLRSGEPINELSYQKLRTILFANRARRPAGERDVLAAMVEPYLFYVNSNLCVRSAIDAPIVDWANIRPIYDKKLQTTFGDGLHAEKLQSKVRELFSTDLPLCEPESVGELLAILRNPDVRELRQFIAECVDQNTSFDRSFVKKLFISLAKGRKKGGGLKKGMSLAAFGAGAIATLTGLPMGPSLAVGAAASIAQEAAGSGIDRWLSGDLRWVYCILDAKQ